MSLDISDISTRIVKFITKEHFCLYTCHHQSAMVMIQLNVSHTDTTLWIFYIAGSSYKMNNIFHVSSEKKTTKSAKEQRYRLDIYTEYSRKFVFWF